MKIKILGIIVLAFLLTGCDVNYYGEISENSFKEKTTIIPDSSKKETIQNKNLESYLESFVGTKIPSFYNADNYNGETESEKEGVEYYEINSYQNGIQAFYDFNLYNLHRSLAMKECFNEINVQKNENIYRINTNNYCKAFDKYSLLDQVTIELLVNYDVLYSNADEVKENHYYWYLDQNNYKNKSISLSFNTVQEDLSEFDPNNKDQNVALKEWGKTHQGFVLLMCFGSFVVILFIIILAKKYMLKKK